MTVKHLVVAFRKVLMVSLSPLVKVDGLWAHLGTPERNVRWDRIIDDAREERHRQLLGHAWSLPNGEPGA
jgi:hypothetical protein